VTFLKFLLNFFLQLLVTVRSRWQKNTAGRWQVVEHSCFSQSGSSALYFRYQVDFLVYTCIFDSI